MKPVFLRSLHNRAVSTIVYALSGAAFLELYIALYPALLSQIQAYDQIAKAFPEAFLKAFGMQDLIFSSFEGYISTEHFSLIWPLLVIFMVVGYASTSLAGEIEQRSLGLSLTQPVSRTQIYFAKYLAGVLMIAIFTILSILVVVPLAALHHVTIHAGNFWTMTMLGFCFGLAVLSLAFALSAALSERSRVSMATGRIFVLMYVANIISGLKDSWNNLQYVSIFHYLQPSGALLHGQLKLLNVTVFLISALILTLVGWVIFDRRDITI